MHTAQTTRPKKNYVIKNEMQGGLIALWAKCPSLCPFVRLPVKGVNCDKRKKCAHILIGQCYTAHKRSFILDFWKEKWLVVVLPEIWEQTGPVGVSINADFQSIFGRSASAVTPSKRSSINTNRN